MSALKLGSELEIRLQHKMPQPVKTSASRFIYITMVIAIFGALSPAFSHSASSNIILPKPLTAEDARHYREVFKLQRIGKWTEAREQFKLIEDKLLESHVLYQQYMHPTKYRSKYPELRHWLEQYATHPGALQISGLQSGAHAVVRSGACAKAE